jgi:Tol biopolymer transport system component
VSSSGAQGNNFSNPPAISGDGRFVAYDSAATNLVAGDTNGGEDVFVRDTTTNKTQRVSLSSSGAQATGGDSDTPAISADGRFVAFLSGATNLVAGDTNMSTDTFARGPLHP